jgi:hypothetical protein
MRLVELPGCGGREANGSGPEIFLRAVAFHPGANRVAFAHIKHLALALALALAVRARASGVMKGVLSLFPLVAF